MLHLKNQIKMKSKKDLLGLLCICCIVAGTRIEIGILDCADMSGWDWFVLIIAAFLILGGLSELMEKE